MNKLPAGAITKKELLALRECPNTIIYKVFHRFGLKRKVKGQISKATLDGTYNKGVIHAKETGKQIFLSSWYGKTPMGCLFTNYLHAYAYSLKCKND